MVYKWDVRFVSAGSISRAKLRTSHVSRQQSTKKKNQIARTSALRTAHTQKQREPSARTSTHNGASLSKGRQSRIAAFAGGMSYEVSSRLDAACSTTSY
jgi:hypothetical protein